METYLLFAIIAGVIFVATIITGIVLRKREHPYPPLLSTIHKLISLTALVFVVLSLSELIPGKDMRITGIALIGLTAVFTLLSLISGGLLVRKTESDSKTVKLHRVSSIFTFVFIILSIIWFV